MVVGIGGVRKVVPPVLVLPFLLLLVGAAIVPNGNAEENLKLVKFPNDQWKGPRGRAFRWSEVKRRRSGENHHKDQTVRIIDGEEVGDSGLFPQVVALATYEESRGTAIAFCTGTLLDEQIVLTAAHCVDTFANVTNLGVSRQESLTFFACAGSTDLEIANSAVCSLVVTGYVAGPSGNYTADDIGVLGLEAGLIGDGVEPIAINFQEPLPATLVYAVGFGNNNRGTIPYDGKLRYADGVYTPPEDCRILKKRALGATDNLLCFDGHYDGSGGTICSGDSGSPLVVKGDTPGENYIIGVASWNGSGGNQRSSCAGTEESVYMSLYSESHRSFVEESVALLGGTLTVKEDPDELTCEGQIAQCKTLRTDGECLESRTFWNMDERKSCCEEAYSESQCVKRVAASCNSTEITAESEDLMSIYDEICFAQSDCGLVKVQNCTESVRLSCETTVDGEDNEFYEPAKCCDDVEIAKTCLSDAMTTELPSECEEVDYFATTLARLDSIHSSFDCDKERCLFRAQECLEISVLYCSGSVADELHMEEDLRWCCGHAENSRTCLSEMSDCESYDLQVDNDLQALDKNFSERQCERINNGDLSQGSCFPGSATVSLQGGGTRRMSELEAGDRVLVSGSHYSDVFGFSHKVEEAMSDFLVIATESGEELWLTPSHYLPVGTDGILKAARMVRVGDILTLGVGKTSAVTNIRKTRMRGLYNPHTLDGTIVVNGVVASTYTEFVHPRLAHWILSLPRALYRLGLKEPLGNMLYGTVPATVGYLVPRGPASL